MSFIAFIFIFILAIFFMLVLTGFSFLVRLWSMVKGWAGKGNSQREDNSRTYSAGPDPKPGKVKKNLSDVKDVEYEKVED
ncbi:MAG: hypothetical protein J5520_02340 [Bacteroidales bacterium]|nr:hypothetical protein [Bacteroidales bacterium]MDT3357396.1 hypothetical protein [Bacteroidota bacterium]